MSQKNLEQLAVLDHVPVGTFVIDSGFKVLFWSASMERWTGLDVKSMVGRDIRVDFPELDQGIYAMRLADIFTGGPPVVFSNQFHKNLLKTYLPNGSPRAQHTTVSGVKLGGAGKSSALFSISDISDLTQAVHIYQVAHKEALAEIEKRKAAEAAFKENAALTSAILRNAVDGIISFNSEGQILMANKAVEKTFAYPAGEMLTKNLQDLVILKEQLPLSSLITKMAAETQQVQVSGREFEGICADGSKIPVLFVVQEVPQGSKDRVFTGVFRDLSSEKQLKNQLIQAQKMEAIGTLAGGIAHDFNNILTSILGYTDLTLQDISADSDAAENLREVILAGKRAKDLIRHMLTFSRRLTPQKRPIYLEPILKEALKLLRPTLPATIEIQVNIQPNLPAIVGDETQFHQILMNLCTNAFHAMQNRGGILTISVTQHTFEANNVPESVLNRMKAGRYLCLLVRDSGCGMSEETQARVFDPFFTTKRVGEGSGMGLSVVHGIVNEHGGDFVLNSALNEGTEFQLFFPVTLESPKTNVVPKESYVDTNYNVLLVDDEPRLVNVWLRLMRKRGYQVEAFCNPVEALAAFRDQPQSFDLVITDQTMPKMTGIELAQAILAIRHLPVILVTGYSETIGPDQATQLGVARFARKPMAADEFLCMVREVLASESENG